MPPERDTTPSVERIAQQADTNTKEIDKIREIHLPKIFDKLEIQATAQVLTNTKLDDIKQAGEDRATAIAKSQTQNVDDFMDAMSKMEDQRITDRKEIEQQRVDDVDADKKNRDKYKWLKITSAYTVGTAVLISLLLQGLKAFFSLTGK